jgi:hypothetical protein
MRFLFLSGLARTRQTRKNKRGLGWGRITQGGGLGDLALGYIHAALPGLRTLSKAVVPKIENLSAFVQSDLSRFSAAPDERKRISEEWRKVDTMIAKYKNISEASGANGSQPVRSQTNSASSAGSGG